MCEPASHVSHASHGFNVKNYEITNIIILTAATTDQITVQLCSYLHSRKPYRSACAHTTVALVEFTSSVMMGWDFKDLENTLKMLDKLGLRPVRAK